MNLYMNMYEHTSNQQDQSLQLKPNLQHLCDAGSTHQHLHNHASSVPLNVQAIHSLALMTAKDKVSLVHNGGCKPPQRKPFISLEDRNTSSLTHT